MQRELLGEPASSSKARWTFHEGEVRGMVVSSAASPALAKRILSGCVASPPNSDVRPPEGVRVRG
jgi:hypothetical protein